MSSNRGQSRVFLGHKDSVEFKEALADLNRRVSEANAEHARQQPDSKFRWAVKTINFKSGNVGLYWHETWNRTVKSC